MIKQFLKNKVVSNAGWLIGGKVIQMVISLLVGLLSARYLGPSNYGVLNYAAAYTAFFTAFCTLGINSVIVKEFVDKKKSDGEIIGTALGLRAVSSLLSLLVIMAISFVLDAGEPITIAVVALCNLGLVFHIFEIFNYWFQSRLESKKTAIASLVAYSLTALYKLYLLITNKSVMYFALATSVDYVSVAVILFYFYKKSGGSKFSFSWEYGKNLLGKSYHFILSGLMVSIYGHTDRIMLKQMLDSAQVGYYATATTLCTMWCFVLTAIIDSMVPKIMETHNENKQKFESYNKLLYCIIFYVSMLVSVLFMVFGKLAIWLLYGEAYLPAAIPLKIITWYTAFSYLGVARNAWIVCENQQKSMKYIYFFAAISNVLLNLIFIPLFGTAGAAMASLAAQIVVTMIIPLFMKGMRRNTKMMVEAILFRIK